MAIVLIIAAVVFVACGVMWRIVRWFMHIGVIIAIVVVVLVATGRLHL
jgi:hypothetical protein